ncbi:MAG: hypothetical protein ACYC9W_00890 [Candidatus Limnocylindria bacterium]
MPDNSSQPSPSDDLEAAERKSKSVDERVPTRMETDVVPQIELPGAFGAYMPQGGTGHQGPLGSDAPSEGEIALEKEGKAQRTPTAHG